VDGEDLVATAARLAAAAHEGTQDKFGRPFFDGHVAAVVAAVQRSGPPPEVVAAAYLHDIVEKTRVTLDDLAAAGIPDRVRTLVGVLTHHHGQPRHEYLLAICADPDALLVKRADHRVNADPARLALLPRERATALARRYRWEYEILFAGNGHRRPTPARDRGPARS
jgi:(p)ppGpp synthase/HD superfamily hydrolase